MNVLRKYFPSVHRPPLSLSCPFQFVSTYDGKRCWHWHGHPCVQLGHWGSEWSHVDCSRGGIRTEWSHCCSGGGSGLVSHPKESVLMQGWGKVLFLKLVLCYLSTSTHPPLSPSLVPQLIRCLFIPFNTKVLGWKDVLLFLLLYRCAVSTVLKSCCFQLLPCPRAVSTLLELPPIPESQFFLVGGNMTKPEPLKPWTLCLANKYVSGPFYCLRADSKTRRLICTIKSISTFYHLACYTHLQIKLPMMILCHSLSGPH